MKHYWAYIFDINIECVLIYPTKTSFVTEDVTQVRQLNVASSYTIKYHKLIHKLENYQMSRFSSK